MILPYGLDSTWFISRDPLGYVDGMSLYAGYFAAGFGMDPWGNIAIVDDVAVISYFVVAAIVAAVIYPTVKKVTDRAIGNFRLRRAPTFTLPSVRPTIDSPVLENLLDQENVTPVPYQGIDTSWAGDDQFNEPSTESSPFPRIGEVPCPNFSKSEDSGKNERHGDRRAEDKAKEQIKDLEDKIKNATGRERKQLEQRRKNIKRNAKGKKKGESHNQKAKGKGGRGGRGGR